MLNSPASPMKVYKIEMLRNLSASQSSTVNVQRWQMMCVCARWVLDIYFEGAISIKSKPFPIRKVRSFNLKAAGEFYFCCSTWQFCMFFIDDFNGFVAILPFSAIQNNDHRIFEPKKTSINSYETFLLCNRNRFCNFWTFFDKSNPNKWIEDEQDTTKKGDNPWTWQN